MLNFDGSNMFYFIYISVKKYYSIKFVILVDLTFLRFLNTTKMDIFRRFCHIGKKRTVFINKLNVRRCSHQIS